MAVSAFAYPVAGRHRRALHTPLQKDAAVFLRRPRAPSALLGLAAHRGAVSSSLSSSILSLDRC